MASAKWSCKPQVTVALWLNSPVKRILKKLLHRFNKPVCWNLSIRAITDHLKEAPFRPITRAEVRQPSQYLPRLRKQRRCHRMNQRPPRMPPAPNKIQLFTIRSDRKRPVPSKISVSTDSLVVNILFNFGLTSEGSQIFAAHTAANVNKVLTITLDKKVISAPTINSAITGGEGTITGSFTADTANALADQPSNPAPCLFLSKLWKAEQWVQLLGKNRFARA